MSRSLVIVAGESQNDTHALEHLIRAILHLKHHPIDVKKLRNPTILSRDAAPKKRATMAQLIAATESIEKKRRPKVVVVAHRDCDEIEPAHKACSADLEQDLRNAGVERPVAATPAWCLETWWMLFPDQVASVRPCWRKLNFGSRNVGVIQNAKEAFISALRPTGVHRCPDYHESDSITIARKIEEAGAIEAETRFRSQSLEEFRAQLNAAFDLGK